jgi:hypothetical protein
VPQIATFTGHSLKDAEAIVDTHYHGRDVQLAEVAVLKLQKRTKRLNELQNTAGFAWIRWLTT